MNAFLKAGAATGGNGSQTNDRIDVIVRVARGHVQHTDLRQPPAVRAVGKSGQLTIVRPPCPTPWHERHPDAERRDAQNSSTS